MLGAATVLLVDVKPTAGLAVATLCFITFVAVRGPRAIVISILPVSLGVAIGLAIHVLVVGSPITSVREGARFAEMVQVAGYYPAEQLWQTAFLRTSVVRWLGALAATSIAIAIAWRWIRSLTARVVLMAGATVTMIVVHWGDHPIGGEGYLGRGVGWWWLRVTGWTLVFVTALAPERRRTLAIGPLVALGALAFGIGSDNGLVRTSALAAALFAAGVLFQSVLVTSGERQEFVRALPAAVYLVCISFLSLSHVAEAMDDPYRLQTQVDDHRVPVALAGLGVVEVSPELRDYVVSMQTIGTPARQLRRATASSTSPAAHPCPLSRWKREAPRFHGISVVIRGLCPRWRT